MSISPKLLKIIIILIQKMDILLKSMNPISKIERGYPGK
jgi:hypothetical protein